MRLMEIRAWQQVALANPLRLSTEALDPRFTHLTGDYSLLLTVYAGYPDGEMFAQPVWHASASRRRDRQVAAYTEDLLALCRSALDGVGDALVGEWVQSGNVAVHLVRRLTAAEDAVVGPAVDVRGTMDSARRLERIRRLMPPGYPIEER